MAHQPDISSTMLSETSKGKWVLQVRAALTAFEYEVAHSYPELKYESGEEFEDLVVKLVEDNLTLSINKQSVSFGKPMVKLGHETNVVFTIDGLFEELNEMSIIQKSFDDINKSKSALVLIKKGQKPQQFILNGDNNHSIELKLENGVYVSDSPQIQEAAGVSITWKVIIAMLIGALILFLIKLKQ